MSIQSATFKIPVWINAKHLAPFFPDKSIHGLRRTFSKFKKKVGKGHHDRFCFKELAGCLGIPPEDALDHYLRGTNQFHH